MTLLKKGYLTAKYAEIAEKINNYFNVSELYSDSDMNY